MECVFLKVATFHLSLLRGSLQERLILRCWLLGGLLPRERLAKSACICGNYWSVPYAIHTVVFSLAKTQVLAPCGVNDFVCGRAAEWVSNGTELCDAAVFGVRLTDDLYSGIKEARCYGRKASLDTIAVSLGVFEAFQQWMTTTTFGEGFSWAVGGMVLTAGLMLISRRKSHRQRQKLAAIQRTARKLETKIMDQKLSNTQRK
ncbi:Folate receptor-like protein [Quillaja saponaria]|uniref:Folate receptor-like protein n=1 Tax=Quillaja saponaria TaxID=32244 RepID=A0AAD7Q1X7_QUISA|nr:Folate receptor-like protein [Quillaja saponaria]